MFDDIEPGFFVQCPIVERRIRYRTEGLPNIDAIGLLCQTGNHGLNIVYGTPEGELTDLTLRHMYVYISSEAARRLTPGTRLKPLRGGVALDW